MENALSSSLGELPEGPTWPSAELMRECRSGRGTYPHCAVQNVLYLVLCYVCPVGAASLVPESWGTVKSLQRWPLKAILRRSSAFCGAGFLLELVSWVHVVLWKTSPQLPGDVLETPGHAVCPGSMRG